ncbi:MAG TPA: zf-HC2 domain-containing protein [Phycisphaerae bacterium]|nr:zf-HC2 domain-containing protein [Phycisphaerae bacterium]
MPHVTDSELIKHVAGELPQPQRARVDEHVAACRPCRDRQREISQTWEVLGDWQVEPLATDLADAVQGTASRQHQAATNRPARWQRRASVLLRAAAAILVAVALGHLAGRWTAPSPSDTASAGADRLARSTDADVVPLGVLELGSATGWADLILDDAVPSEQEGSS